jgi:phage terminase small subunit
MAQLLEGNLTPRQQRFVEEYLVDLNATRAYTRAGYRAKNDNVAAVSASRLLRNAKVRAALETAQQVRSHETHVRAFHIIEWLKEEANRYGKGNDPMARLRAIELLGMHLGMFSAWRLAPWRR